MKNEAVINGFQVYRGFLSGYLNISREKEYINSINVFPVPDGDTGSNMLHTFETIAARLESRRSVKDVLNHIADLSLEGARGNSGLILSQYLNGLARHSDDHSEMTFSAFGKVAFSAVSDAYDALEEPKEGTILTVIRSWAETIDKESRKNHTLSSLLSSGLQEAKKALNHTTAQLKVLKDNDVPDAGAWGFVSFLEGMGLAARKNLSRRSIEKEVERIRSNLSIGRTDSVHRLPEEVKFRYCTEVLLQTKQPLREDIRRSLLELGDSLVVGRGRERLRLHMHTNSPADIVRLLKDEGPVLQQKVDDMVRQEQMTHSRKGRIGIVTDSIADIPLEILDKYQIHVLNIDILWDKDSFLDRLTITPEEFYRQQLERESFPSTSAPSQKRIEYLLESLMAHYEGLLVLPVARKLSGTWQQFTLAAQKYNINEKKVAVIDTCLNSAAQGLLVHKTALAAAEGKDLNELIEMAEEVKRRAKIFVSVETFKYMIKGGRVSPLKGVVARLLNLKPIVSLDIEGAGIAMDKAFSAKGLLNKISLHLRTFHDSRGIEEYVIVHAAARSRADRFAALVEKITGRPPLYITDISPVVGMHSGSGAVAIGLILKS